MVQSPLNSLWREATVKELLIFNSDERRIVWNEESIDEIFWAEEVMSIKNIPIGRSMRGDTFIWCLTENEFFTVKCVYRYARTL